MKIILLSGGSGKRLWPLSNDARSKQFLRLLTGPDGEKESMIQRVVRQIKEADITGDIIVATGANQKDSIENQLGDDTTVVTEPCRRDTFPAIVLACSYLASNGVDNDEPIIVMPCDQYTEDKYFTAIKEMGQAVASGYADLILLGIKPTYPSSKYGYIVPCADSDAGQNITKVHHFTEKPDVDTARSLIEQGAMWNGGVFAFRLGYLMEIARKLTGTTDFTTIREHYEQLPKISFDYEVVEKAKSIAVVGYDGQWKDLGTWNTLTDEISTRAFGNVVRKDSDNCYAYNELEIPLVCIGADDMVVAATYDGILVSRRSQTEDIKHLVSDLSKRPMYEERRWGEYKVIDYVEFPDGFSALTKQLTLRPGKSISYQRHNCRSEVWTFISGEGLIVLDGETRKVTRGDVINIAVGQLHALKAITPLTFIEVQSGANLVEEDIERFPWTW
jgi:mannose-6-phosphate isomerase